MRRSLSSFVLACAVFFAPTVLAQEAKPSNQAAPAVQAPVAQPAKITPSLLNSRLRGLSLEDLGLVKGEYFDSVRTPMAATVAERIRGAAHLDLKEILSTSIVEQHDSYWVVDVVGRSKRFKDHDSQTHKKGRVGIVRVRVPVSSAGAGEPTVISEHSLDGLNVRVDVSISDWIAVVTEPSLGFQRIYPLGGGAIDRGARTAHYLTSLTPVTDDGRLNKRHAYRELRSPWYFKGKPYLPISVPRERTNAKGQKYSFHAESNIAFHIWQAPAFERGSFSRGCMRMRTEDLMELGAFVFGSKDSLVITTTLPPKPEHHHPVAMAEHYMQLQNFGTADKPRTQLQWGQLYKLEKGSLAYPAPSELKPMDFRSRPIIESGTDGLRTRPSN